MLNTFEEWKQWKESRQLAGANPTCDTVGCREIPALVLPQQKIFFCAKHAAEKSGYSGLARMYGEDPILYSLYQERAKVVK